jgi:arylsulfatase A-like enzyme
MVWQGESMKKLVWSVAVVALLGAVAWQNKVSLLVWAVPKVSSLISPIGPNQPIEWQSGPSEAAQPPTERPPNIILVMTDDMGFNDISLYNGGAADGSLMTPNIDALAHQGVTFTQGYAANAVCAPSRASMMTGRYSTRFGFEFTPIFKVGPRIFDWMQQEAGEVPLPNYVDMEIAEELPEMQFLGMPSEQITIAEVLKERGYHNVHIGKWHLGAENGMRPEDQGFDESLYMAGLLYQPEDHPDVVNAKRPDQAIEKMVWASAQYVAQFNGGERFEPDGYLTDYYSREAVKVIENNKNRPFFLFLSHWGIHNPLQATRQDYEALAHIEDHHLRVYAGMIRAVDRSIGMITQALEQHGLTENTLILFTSDNGGAQYIGLPDINKPFRGWKLNHFEGGTHVPYLAKWPVRIPSGSQLTAPVHHVDLFQTIAAAANAPVPTDRVLDGVDLVPYVTGTAPGRPHETLFWRQGHHQSVRHQDWKLIRAEVPEEMEGEPKEQVWLFDLAQDPTEQVNLASQRPDQVALLKRLLAAHNAEQAEPMWPSAMNGPQLIDKDGTQSYQPGDEFIYWPN